MTKANGNHTNTIRKILNNEIAQLIAIIAGVYTIIAMIILPLKRMEQQIDTIQNNELKHIEADIKDIKTEAAATRKDQTETDTRQDQMINEIDKKLERILTILERK